MHFLEILVTKNSWDSEVYIPVGGLNSWLQ